MEILLLSDTADPNKDIQNEISMGVLKRGGKVAYVSSTPQDETKKWFHNTEKEYASFDPKIELTYFDLSDNFSDQQLEGILQFGTIHLSGGNTFGFLDYIKQRSFEKILRTHLDNKGLIIGVSAGSLVLTPNIKIAEFPEADENVVGLTDLSALNFVNFEFQPHFKESQIEMLQDYSKSSDSIIYAATDSDGVLVIDEEIKLFGKVLKFYKGNLL